jgi:hypothetical protein
MSQKRLTVHIDDDLASFIREMAQTNGISIQKYTNNLLDKAIIQEKGVVSLSLASEIMDKRRAIADKAFEDYTFEGVTINDHNGWLISSSNRPWGSELTLSKSVYYHLHDGNSWGHQRVGTFTVTFTGKSMTPTIKGDLTD